MSICTLSKKEGVNMHNHKLTPIISACSWGNPSNYLCRMPLAICIKRPKRRQIFVFDHVCWFCLSFKPPKFLHSKLTRKWKRHSSGAGQVLNHTLATSLSNFLPDQHQSSPFSLQAEVKNMILRDKISF